MRVATVKLSWTRSPSADVTSRTIVITKNGEETRVDIGPEVGEYQLEVEASSSVQFKTIVRDAEGSEVSSETYTFSISDLEAPLPDTNLTHEILAVHEVTP